MEFLPCRKIRAYHFKCWYLSNLIKSPKISRLFIIVNSLTVMRSVFWMLGTLSSFSLMAVCVRELNNEIPTHQILFFRSVIGLILIVVIILISNNSKQLRTTKFRAHGLRNIFHFSGQYGWYLGIGLLPLAEVFALEFTVPLWTLLIAALVLGEKITRIKLFSILLASLGVIIILKPGVAIIDSASFIVLASACCYALSHVVTKSLACSESPLNIVFYMCLMQLPFGLFFTWLDWQEPNQLQYYLLITIGLTALSAHYCLVKAMHDTDVSIVVTLDFFRLPLIAVIGALFYSEEIGISLFIGAVMMLIANIINLDHQKKHLIKGKI